MKDINILPSEECISQYKPLVCDFKIRKVKDTRKNFVPKKKIWKLHQDSVNSDFRSCINQDRASSQKGVSVECYWNILIGALSEGVIPAEWELNATVNCYKVKDDSLEKGSYRDLKLTDQILEITERVFEKLIRQQVDIGKMQFCFMPGFGTTNATSILRQLQEK